MRDYKFWRMFSIMADSVMKRKKEIELMRVQTARMELELKIEELLTEVDRLRKAITIQEQTENKLKEDIKNL
jgi:hypothetical protein